MNKRVFLLFPGINTVVGSFIKGFTDNGWEALHYDIGQEINRLQIKLHNHISKVPFSLRQKWYDYFISGLNRKQLAKFMEFQPDLVIAYNGMLLDPETVRAMQKTAKVCFFLGDSPFFTHQNDYYLSALALADHVLCPDTYWQQQLNTMGIDNTVDFLIGANPDINYRMQVTPEARQSYAADLVFIGINYVTAAGYKRASFLSQFAHLNFRIYISERISRWYNDFPELAAKVVRPYKRLTNQEMNLIMNCCKIYPVDANPGLINGVHLRIFECIGSGILPLAEYRRDIETLFGKSGIPIIKNYKNAASLAEHFLKNEAEREQINNELRSLVQREYAPQAALGNLLEKIKL